MTVAPWDNDDIFVRITVNHYHRTRISRRNSHTQGNSDHTPTPTLISPSPHRQQLHNNSSITPNTPQKRAAPLYRKQQVESVRDFFCVTTSTMIDWGFGQTVTCPALCLFFRFFFLSPCAFHFLLLFLFLSVRREERERVIDT